MSKDPKRVRVGTRSSSLALRQTESVVRLLGEIAPELDFEVVKITTTGDRLKDQPIESVDVKGMFVKELEIKLLRGEIDIAVHSLKDIPSELPEGLMIGAIPRRCDPRDVFVSRRVSSLSRLPAGATVGTSSPRRAVQIKAIRNDVIVIPMRGNIETRLRKMADRDLDGIIVAAAAMERLGLQEMVSEYLEPSVFLPAAGQGALGVEVREETGMVRELVKMINDPKTSIEVSAERAFVRTVGGGCRIPVASLAVLRGTVLSLDGLVATSEAILKERGIEEIDSGSPLQSAEDIGKRLGELLLQKMKHGS